MSKNLWLCSMITGTCLFGCATGPQTLTERCTGENCTVNVTVTNCSISVDPPDLLVPRPFGAKRITWVLTPSSATDYIFDVKGIEFKTSNGVFSGRTLGHNATTYMWIDAHQAAGQFPYSVTVIKTGTDPVTCPTLDPLISNQ